MSVCHVLYPDGLTTVCGEPLRTLPKTHKTQVVMSGRLCVSCRKVLRASPQLVNAVLAKRRAGGENVSAADVYINPARRRQSSDSREQEKSPKIAARDEDADDSCLYGGSRE